MRYKDTPERSGELLRLTIPLMSRHGSAHHPISYAIWYEFASGRIPELTAELTSLTKDGTRLSEDNTYRLYQQYVASVAEKNISRVNGKLDRVLGDVTGSMAQTHGKTRTYSTSLEALGTELSSGIAGTQAIRNRIESVLTETKDTTASIDLMCSFLEESRQAVIKLREELERTRDEVMQDALTGITNRRGLDAAIERFSMAALKDRTDLCVLMLDIDHFKKVNDVYGHLFGDRVLRSIAQTLQSSVKGRDVAARYGGEEFAVLLPATPIRGAVALAEAVRAQVQNTKFNRLDKNEVVEGITVSIGASAYRPNERLADFMDRADQALYASKNGGRNRVTAM